MHTCWHNSRALECSSSLFRLWSLCLYGILKVLRISQHNFCRCCLLVQIIIMQSVFMLNTAKQSMLRIHGFILKSIQVVDQIGAGSADLVNIGHNHNIFFAHQTS